MYSGQQKSPYSNIFCKKKKNSPHRLNTLSQSVNMTSRQYLGDHLKERLHNR